MILALVALGGIGAYLSLNRSAPAPSIPTPAPLLISPTPGPITVSGEISCLPKKGSGTNTLECAFGLRGTDGLHYGLKNLFQHDPEYKFSVTGLRVEVSGIFTPEEMLSPGGAKYDVVGTIDVTSIKEVEP